MKKYRYKIVNQIFLNIMSGVRGVAIVLLLISSLVVSPLVFAGGNTSNSSFYKAKKKLMALADGDSHYAQTLYCGAAFNTNKDVSTPEGFTSIKYVVRSKRVEFEHVVPAENFGRNFIAWRDGHEKCVTRSGVKYTGRRCAGKVNREYKLMQADLYNLYPAIGSVNALRSNYTFTMLGDEKSDFGSCDMRIENRKAQPPIRARGRIARAYLYMDLVYSKYKMSKKTRKLMTAWDKMYPVTNIECKRAEIIRELQGNVNPILKSRCNKA